MRDLESFVDVSEEILESTKKILEKYREKIFVEKSVEKLYKIGEKAHEKADEKAIKIIKNSRLKANVLLKDKNLRIKEIKLSKNSEYKIILDTIDGSANFARDFPFYSFSFTLLKGNNIEHAVYSRVVCLVSGDEFFAFKGKGAFFNGRKIKVKKPQSFRRAIIGLDTYLESVNYNKNLPNIVKKLIEYLSPHGDIRRIGTNAFAQCLVAKGSLDMFIDLRGTQSILEIIPSKLVVEEAKGVVTNGSGNELKGSIYENQNTDAIFSASRNLVKELLSVIHDKSPHTQKDS